LFFAADDGVHGREPWVSDGTLAGTHQLVDLRLGGAGSNPAAMSVALGRAVFAATDGNHGIEPWVSDGTPEGTAMSADVNPTGNSSPHGFIRLGTSLLFAADDGIHGEELHAMALTG
jgi:ELWxxDGT repeat protein